MTKRKPTKKRLEEIRKRAEALIEKDPGPAESLSPAVSEFMSQEWV